MFEVLGEHPEIVLKLSSADSQALLIEEVNEFHPDAILYNWSQLIGGWISYAPFHSMPRQALLYHDGVAKFEEFNAILFSDPTMERHENWFPIGRPIPTIVPPTKPDSTKICVGVNGFLGAWGNMVVEKAVHDWGSVKIRMHLPYAIYGDSGGGMAQWSADYCRGISDKAEIEVSHDFLDRRSLVSWLSKNDINCYMRPTGIQWRGVSSVLDFAMASGRPIAINKCSAFRHMFDCQPTICMEDRSMPDILSSGLTPMEAKYKSWHPVVVAGQVIEALNSV